MNRLAILALVTALSCLLSGCVLDLADAAYLAATGRHIDDGWYGPKSE